VAVQAVVCGSASDSVRQCVIVRARQCAAVQQCAAVCAAVCSSVCSMCLLFVFNYIFVLEYIRLNLS
jgi:uncharacterized membrane protein